MWLAVLLGIAALCSACNLYPGNFYDCRSRNLSLFDVPTVRIWKADFSDNNVVEIVAGTFVNRDVSIFVFSGIQIIRSYAFSNLPNTTIIYVTNGRLTLIESGSFAAMPRLVHLYISNNVPVIACFAWPDISNTLQLQITVTTALKTVSINTNEIDCSSSSSSFIDVVDSVPGIIIGAAVCAGFLLIGGFIYSQRQTRQVQIEEPAVLYDNFQPPDLPAYAETDMLSLPNAMSNLDLSETADDSYGAAPIDHF